MGGVGQSQVSFHKSSLTLLQCGEKDVRSEQAETGKPIGK